MARPPNQEAEKAHALYKNGKKLKEIAELLDIPEGTVRSWKNRYGWDCNVADKKCNVANEKRGFHERKRSRQQMKLIP